MSGVGAVVKITAIGEVRDKDGNLISAEPVEATITLSPEQFEELIKEQN